MSSKLHVFREVVSDHCEQMVTFLFLRALLKADDASLSIVSHEKEVIYE